MKMGTPIRLLGGAAVIATVAGAAAIAQPAAADAVADFYKGKNLTIFVGFAPGGTVDLTARIISRHIGNHLPGKPNVIVQNMPGGGGLTALNHLANVAPKDGTALLTMLPTNAVEPQMGNPNARWETEKLNWIGTLTRDSPSCVVSGKSGIKSIEDAKEREIVFGATGWSSTMAQHPATLANLFGYKIRVVVGYPGIAPTFQAVEAGEVDGLCSFYTSQALFTHKRQVEGGELVPIVQMGEEKHPVFGDAPLVYDLATTDEQRTILQFVFGLAELARPMAAPPGVPADRVAALRQAFWTAANSPELKADADRSGMIVNPVNGADTEATFREAVSAPQETLDRVKDSIRLQ